MKVKDIRNKSISISERIDLLYRWRNSEGFLEYIQNERQVTEEVLPLVEEALSSPIEENKNKALSILIRIQTGTISIFLIEKVIGAMNERNIINVSLGTRCLIEVTKKTPLTPAVIEKIIDAINRFFMRVNMNMSAQTEQAEIRKAILLSSEPVILLLMLVQVAREETLRYIDRLLPALRQFSVFFMQNKEMVPVYLINENVKLQCITTHIQITTLFMNISRTSLEQGQQMQQQPQQQIQPQQAQQIHPSNSFITDTTIFLLSLCPNDAVSLKKDIYHQLSMIKSEKKRTFSGYSEAILKDGILLQPRNPVLKLLGLTLSTEFLIMFRDTTHRHLSLKVCKEAARILAESNEHTLNKLCANVLVQINDTIIGDTISIGEKSFFVRMNYLSFLAAFKKYAVLPVSEETKNVLRSLIRGMKNTMHYFSLFHNIPSNAIVFSLKCFTPTEINELSECLSLAFRMFASFELEKKSDIIILCEFLLIFFYLDVSSFQSTLMDNIDELFDLTRKNKDMFTIWRQFLAYAGVARKFSSLALERLLEIVHNDRDKAFIIAAFKEIFISFSVHTKEIESVVTVSLKQIFNLCLTTERRLQYTLEIVRELFKAAEKEKLDVLHKEITLALPLFFSRIEKIAQYYPESTDHIELCLSIPVKISVLLPFLGQMAPFLVRALQMKEVKEVKEMKEGVSLSKMAMEVLETCVDNLNSDFLLSYLGESMDAIFVSLVDLVKQETHSVMAIKLLGKLSGKTSGKYFPPCNSHPGSIWVSASINGYTDRKNLPFDPILETAAVIVSGEASGCVEEALSVIEAFFCSFFAWNEITPEVLSTWEESLLQVSSTDFEELHQKVHSAEIDLPDSPPQEEAPMALPKRLISALFLCGGATAAVPAGSNSGSNSGSNGRASTATNTSLAAPLKARQLLHSIYQFLALVKVLELVNFKEFQQKIRADTTGLIDCLVDAFDGSTLSLAQELLSLIYSTSLSLCGTREKASQMTVFYSILHAFCSACYSYSDRRRACGVEGISYMARSLPMAAGWLLFQEARMVNALLAALLSQERDASEAVTESICYIVRTAHDPAQEQEPLHSEHFKQLLRCFAQELSHPNARIRKVSRACLIYTADLFSGELSSFLAPVISPILTQALSKPLRALPEGVQRGHMELLSFLFGLRPPLLQMDDRLERFLGEAFRAVAAAGATPGLRVSALRLFVSAAVAPGVTSSALLMKISQVLIKGLFSREKEIVETAREGLRQMQIQGRDPPREVLQVWLAPIVSSFVAASAVSANASATANANLGGSAPIAPIAGNLGNSNGASTPPTGTTNKRASPQVITGLAYLQELDPNLFDAPMLSALIEVVSGAGPGLPKETLSLCYEILAGSPGASEELVSSAALLYVGAFKVRPSLGVCRGFHSLASTKRAAVTALFNRANEDDGAFYLLRALLRSSSQVRALARPLALLPHSGWRHFVLIDAAGESLTRGEAERALEQWRDLREEALGEVLRKWALTSGGSLLAYYAVEEQRMAAVSEIRAPAEAERAGALLREVAGTGELFSAPAPVQRRVLRSIAPGLIDKDILCVKGAPLHWRASVCTEILEMTARGDAEATPAALSYMKEAVQMEEMDAVDALRVTAYIAQHDPDPDPALLLPLLTAHPEYAEYVVDGIASLLRKRGAAFYIDSLSAVAQDETLYKTCVFILLPVAARVPEAFLGSGLEASLCGAVQRLFLSGSARVGVLLIEAVSLWYSRGALPPAAVAPLCSAYISYIIHQDAASICPGIEALPVAPGHIEVYPEYLSGASVLSLYRRAAACPPLAKALRPAVLACGGATNANTGTGTGTATVMEQLVLLVSKIDRAYLETLFDGLVAQGGASAAQQGGTSAAQQGGTSAAQYKAVILCASLLGRAPAIERALSLLEEALRAGNVSLLPETLPGILKAASADKADAAASDTANNANNTNNSTPSLLAKVLLRCPEVLKHPEAVECVVSIVQAPGVPASLKESLLLAMDAEETQEIRLGLVLNAYLERHSSLSGAAGHRREMAAGWNGLFVKGLVSSSAGIRNDFFRLFGETVSGAPGERLSRLCALEWELFPGPWLCVFARMMASLLTVHSFSMARFWRLSDGCIGGFNGITINGNNTSTTTPIIASISRHLSNSSMGQLTDAALSLLHHTPPGAAALLKALLPQVVEILSEDASRDTHLAYERMIVRVSLAAAHSPNSIAGAAETLILSLNGLCQRRPRECKLLEAVQASGAWTAAAALSESPLLASVFRELHETDYLLGHLRVSAVYPETVRALLLQQLGHIKDAQQEYEEVQAKAQTGLLLFNDAEYTIWETQWTECAKYLQQWDLLHEIGVATKRRQLAALGKWHTADFSIDSERASFRAAIQDLGSPADTAFYELFLMPERTPPREREEALRRIVSSTVGEVLAFPGLSPRQLHAVEKFQVVLEMNEAHALLESADLRRDLPAVLLAWKERAPLEWASLGFWSTLVRWRTHVFASLWNSHSKEKALQYRGYHETAHILNLFSRALRRHRAYPAALSNLESIYTLPNIEIADAYMKLEEHARCYIEMGEYAAGLDLLGMTNLNYFTGLQKSGVFLLRGELLQGKGALEDAARLYAQAAQVYPANARAWYKWGALSMQTSAVNAVNAFMQAAAISPGQVARKAITSVVSVMDSAADGEMEKVFESTAAEIDAWCFVPFVPQMAAILSRTGSPMAEKALGQVARVYPQAVYFPVRNALEQEKKAGVERGPVCDLWTFLKTGFTLMCINIEGIVEGLTLRLRYSAEEEFYRLICALLCESLQQLFGKEASENGSLCDAVRKIGEMLAISSLSGRYGGAFRREFREVLAAEGGESPSEEAVWRMAHTLARWRSALERVLGSVSRGVSMENVARRLIDFDQRSEDVEVFGQYVEVTERAKQMVRISRFEPEIRIRRRAGISLRCLGIRGSNGVLYRVAVQMPAGKAVRREERFIQALALVNAALEESVEARKRNVSACIRRVVALNHQTRLIFEEERSTALFDALARRVGGGGVYGLIFECRRKIERVPGVIDRADALDPERRLEMFVGMEGELGNKILVEAFGGRFLSQNEFFYFRKRVSISHSVHCLISYLFCIGSRMPSRMAIGDASGGVYSSEFYPSFFERPSLEEVPFRLTPGMQRLIGRFGLEGPFLSVMYHTAQFFRESAYLIDYMGALAREDVGPEAAERALRLIRERLEEVTRAESVPAKGIIRLVGVATAPERLAMMDPQWHPWL